jgi:hypothetical protein
VAWAPGSACSNIVEEFCPEANLFCHRAARGVARPGGRSSRRDPERCPSVGAGPPGVGTAAGRAVSRPWAPGEGRSRPR